MNAKSVCKNQNKINSLSLVKICCNFIMTLSPEVMHAATIFFEFFFVLFCFFINKSTKENTDKERKQIEKQSQNIKN